MNIIIDVSYLFHKSYSIYSYMIDPGGKKLETLIQKSGMAKKFFTDMTSILRKVDYVSRVIVCADSESWRTQYYKHYKADRSSMPQGFHDTLDKCLERMDELGFIVSRVDGFEADDLIALWTRKLTSGSHPVMIVSGDADIHQCINSCSVVYNNRSNNSKVNAWRGVRDYVLEGIEEILESSKIEYVDPTFVRFEKILTGDDGDNIPSGFPEGGVGPKTSKKIYEKFKKNMSFPLSDDDFTREGLAWAIESVTSKPYDIENMMRNLQLVSLDPNNLPEDLVMEANDQIEREITRYNYKGNFNYRDILLNSFFIVN